MENKLYTAKETIASKLELPRDIILDLPRITILANNEINIENHKGVVIFEEDKVKINSNVGPIAIYGKDFKILFIGGNTITLSGNFKSVVYENHE
ncbi:sporulation protein YqfC [Clostridium sp. CS001]|uniref:sporulation protein YqfC n=1 Tax=Clostridium sp. CS001 TaxID=2880648 RepID=UPI001CF4F38D|nr:sporulation protein YqfC [Clostridium sp. CS001]MCB2288781.1 sporulation protein YqfC [Clostridium sp. CS001]